TISPRLRSGLADQPFIQSRSFEHDRIYVGHNYFGPELPANRTASLRVSTDGGMSFRLFGLDARPANTQDAPCIRPSVANDGTVYVAFIHWTSQSARSATSGLRFKGDVIVVRDDEGALGTSPFLALVDPVDSTPGRIVASGRT